jgi:uncharacterized protein (DUF4415 family)
MGTTKPVASSRREKLVRKSDADIRAYFASPEGKRELQKRKAFLTKHPEPSPDDMKDIPLFDGLRPEDFRPVKHPVTVRIDADILSWLKSKGGRYQTHMNAALRDAMLADRKR